ncbi:MAG: iron ABC transporter permease [Bacteroidales bacterium]|nr:iron ABC transporter permease [Bacteroidales bacterium]
MKRTWAIFILIIILLFAFILDLSSGSLNFSISHVLEVLFNKSSNTDDFFIISELRLPRVFTAILVGIALPISGLLLQTLFKNPLAGPYIFGISSGASLGVAVLLLGLSFLGFTALPGSFSIAIAGILGAGLILLLILLISIKINDSLTILIIGVMLGSGIGALVNLMQYFSAAPMLKKFVIWTMGSLDAVQNEQLWYFALMILIPSLVAVILSKFFDSLYLGDENAQTLGVNVKLLRLSIFVITGLMTGIATAFCGPIGFIGIAIPHLARIIFKTSKHLHLVIFSALIGAIIMLLSDALSHSFESQIIPINSITAILGIPIIIWVIFRNKKFN